jgi:alpha-1,2-mannosyltransferase
MDAAWAKSRWPLRLFHVAVALILLGVGIQYADKSADSHSAFVRWRSQVQELARGEDAYRHHNYPNGPIMALILYPISLLGRCEFGGVVLDLGALSWFILKVGMTLALVVWTGNLIQETNQPFPPWARATMLLLALQPIIGDLSHGNINLFIFFLVTGALCAFRGGFDLTAGTLLALAICCKLTPALFVPYFLWKRAWRTVIGCVIGLVLFSLLVPAAFVGMERAWELEQSWLEVMVWPYVRDGQVWTEHTNQSIPGLLFRLTTDSPSFLEADVRPTGYHNLLSLDPGTVKWIVKSCGLAFLGLMCWRCRTPTQPRRSWRLAAEYALITLGMLLLSERTWKHHCVTLLLPAGVQCYCLWTQTLPRARRVWLIITLIAVGALITAPSTAIWEPLGYRTGAKLCEVYGAYTWATVLLAGALVMLLRGSTEVVSNHSFAWLGEANVQTFSASDRPASAVVSSATTSVSVSTPAR